MNTLGACIVGPAFIITGNRLVAANREAEGMNIHYEALEPYLPKYSDVAPLQEIVLDVGTERLTYLISGKKVFYEGNLVWFVQLIHNDQNLSLRNVNRVSKARQIMLQAFSEIDHLDTDQDIYEFILDNCAKAIEHVSLCSLMVVEGDMVRLVAKKGFPDSVMNMELELKSIFLSVKTGGKCDRVVIIDDLKEYMNVYNKNIRTEKEQRLLGSTLSAPIILDNKLYAIMNFDSVRTHAFTPEDEELLYLIKTNIEIILANHQMHEEIRRMSQHDMLTGLYNRAYLMEYIEKHKSERFVVGVLDLNNLKASNDNYGHVVGDQLIKYFADRLDSSFPNNATFFRMGGDEFACVAFRTSEDEMLRLMKDFRETLMYVPMKLEDGKEVTVTFGCGFSTHEPYEEFVSSYKRADERMYEDKRAFKKSQNQ